MELYLLWASIVTIGMAICFMIAQIISLKSVVNTYSDVVKKNARIVAILSTEHEWFKNRIEELENDFYEGTEEPTEEKK